MRSGARRAGGLMCVVLGLALGACDDSADDGGGVVPLGGDGSMGSADGMPEPEPEPDAMVEPEPDMAVDPAEGDPGELWRLTVSIAEAGGLALGVQLEVWSDAERTVFERVALRAVDNADMTSEVLAEVRAVAIDGEGRFVMDFGDLTLPGPYNPAGVPVPLTLRIEGHVVDDQTWCGDVRGRVPLLMAELTQSTFGAAPWPAPALGACEDGGEGPGAAFIGGERPAEVLVPSTYDAERSWPLVVVLHGFGASGRVQAGYMRLIDRVEADGVILVMPDGTFDLDQSRHWQARGCCGNRGEVVDDLGYLVGLVDEASGRWNIDPAQVFAVGHSNGGFMAHDLACLASDVFRGVVSLAGSGGLERFECPGADVAVLNVHGDADATILYDGAGWHMGAEASVQRWVDINGCGAAEDGVALNLDTAVAGAETEVRRWADCSAPVEAWRLVGSGHVPQFDDGFATTVIAWLINSVDPDPAPDPGEQ